MNKIFNKFLIGLLFVLGVVLIPAYKADATLIVTVLANGQPSLTVSKGTEVSITWRAPGATSCTNNFGGENITEGSFTFNADVTRTFTVDCYAPDANSVYQPGVYYAVYNPGAPNGVEYIVCLTLPATQDESFNMQWTLYNIYTGSRQGSGSVVVPKGSYCSSYGWEEFGTQTIQDNYTSVTHQCTYPDNPNITVSSGVCY